MKSGQASKQKIKSKKIKAQVNIEIIFIILILIVGITLFLLLFNYKFPSSGKTLYEKAVENLGEKIYISELFSTKTSPRNKTLEVKRITNQSIVSEYFVDAQGKKEHKTEILNLYCNNSKIVYIKLPNNVSIEYISFNITNFKK
ncbi:MAG: hypothetical protein ACP5H9_04545 [Candidatus Woesearchaeota archaeon]